VPFSKLKESLANEVSIKEGLTYREVDPKELKRIKDSIRSRLKRQQQREAIIKAVIIAFIIGSLGYATFELFSGVIKDSIESHERTNDHGQSEYYPQLIRDGNAWLDMGEFKPAFERFNNALLWQPLDLDANMVMSKAYLLASVSDSSYCIIANKSMQRTYKLSAEPEMLQFQLEAFAARVGAISTDLVFIPEESTARH
jgi:hypothetical protein